MPQMSPMNWVILFFYFSIIFMFINSTNYFIVKYNFFKKTESKMFNKINWKW